MTLTIRPVPNIPMIQPGDDLSEIVFQALLSAQIDLQDGDIIVLAQKIVSKSEGRLVNLTEVTPSDEAVELAVRSQKDPRFAEMVLRESRAILRTRPGTIIAEHRQGFICANAGIDHSNVQGPWGSPEDWILLLPEDADASARQICQGLEARAGVRLGVMIIDTHGRAWRNGAVGMAIGLANVPGLVDLRGTPDLYGFRLRVTLVGAADELAAAASLVMGQAAERLPAAHVRGFPYALRESSLAELIRPKEQDLFR